MISLLDLLTWGSSHQLITKGKSYRKDRMILKQEEGGQELTFERMTEPRDWLPAVRTNKAQDGRRSRLPLDPETQCTLQRETSPCLTDTAAVP